MSMAGISTRLDSAGQKVQTELIGMGRFTKFGLAAGWWTWRGVFNLKRLQLIVPQLYAIGTKSIPVVMMVGAFVGAVLGLETYDQLAAVGQQTHLGGIIDLSVVKQIGPVLAAVMVAGRVGGAISAEIGTMRVTEQLDALTVMGSDPVAYLVVPRVVACVLMLPVLTVFSDVLGVFGGWLVVVGGFKVDAAAYWQFSALFVGNWGICVGLMKSVVFGLCIGLISCYKGFHCGSGAAGVGRASTDSFVVSFLTIIVINFFLAKFFDDLYGMLYSAPPTAFG